MPPGNPSAGPSGTASGATVALVARLRKRLAVTATATLMGILLSATGEPGIGGFMTMGALVSLLFTLHQFGRTGPA